MLRAILLDVDGTLLQSNEAHARAWRRALAEFGYDFPIASVLRWIGMGGDKVLHHVDPELSDDHGKGEKISERRQAIFLKEFVETLEPTAGARPLVERFREKGLHCVIASSAKGSELAALLKAAHVDDLIDQAATSDDAKRSKPDPDIITEALEKASCAPNEALYLGDTPYDITAAHAAGVPIIALTCGGWYRTSLARADAVYDDPADLLAAFDRDREPLLKNPEKN